MWPVLDHHCNHYGKTPPNTDNIIIATDGACMSNGCAAVFVCDLSEDNAGGIVHDDSVHSSQKVELGAGLLALIDAVKMKMSTMTDPSQVMIQTDSDYLAKARLNRCSNGGRGGCRSSTEYRLGISRSS